MTVEEMQNDIMAILNHSRVDLYEKYETAVTLTIADRIIEDIKSFSRDLMHNSEGILVSENNCEGYFNAVQQRIRDDGTEMAKLLRIHGHTRDMQATAHQIAREMSASLGHHKKSIMLSCTSYSMEDIDKMPYDEITPE